MMGNIISLLALFLAALAFWDTRRSNRSGMRLTEQEVELVRHQLMSIRTSAEQERQANVSARMFKEGKNWRVRVYNVGPSDAKNVRLLLDDHNRLVSANAIDGKFPMGRMEKGQSVDFWAGVTMSSPKKETLVIQWDDPSGVNRENRVEITL